MLSPSAVRATPEMPRRLPARRLALVVAGLVLGAIVARTVRTVLRMREAAARVEALHHDGTVGAGLDEPIELAVLGDSAAAGHGIGSADEAFPRQLASQLAAATGRRVRVTSQARDGARTRDVVRDQVPLVGVGRPDIVVVGVGVNDALARRPSGEVRQDTLALLDALAEAAPQATVLLVGCPDLGLAPGLPWALRGVVGRRCRTVARAQRDAAAARGVPFADTGVLLRELPRAIARDGFGADGFHPGAAGARALAELGVRTLLTNAA